MYSFVTSSLYLGKIPNKMLSELERFITKSQFLVTEIFCQRNSPSRALCDFSGSYYLVII